MIPAEPYADALQALRSKNPTNDPACWEEAKHDAELFLKEWGAQAKEIGWRDDELFGLHPTAPFTRYDAMGLVWMLRGRKVLALTDKWADLGATKIYRVVGPRGAKSG